MFTACIVLGVFSLNILNVLNYIYPTRLLITAHNLVSKRYRPVMCKACSFKPCCLRLFIVGLQEGICCRLCCVGRDSSVCRATHHGLDCPGVVSRCGGEIFRTRAERSWSLPSHLYNGYWVSYQGVKRPGRDVYHPPPSGAEVRGSPSVSSWPVVGRTSPFYSSTTGSLEAPNYCL